MRFDVIVSSCCFELICSCHPDMMTRLSLGENERLFNDPFPNGKASLTNGMNLSKKRAKTAPCRKSGSVAVCLLLQPRPGAVRMSEFIVDSPFLESLGARLTVW